MSNVKSSQQAAKDVISGLDGIARTTQAQFKAAVAVPQAIIEANWAMASEILNFVSRRLQAQADLCSSLGRCQEFAEAVEAQRKFSERVTQDYSEEVGQLSEVVRKNIASLSAVGADLATDKVEKGRLAA